MKEKPQNEEEEDAQEAEEVKGSCQEGRKSSEQEKDEEPCDLPFDNQEQDMQAMASQIHIFVPRSGNATFGQ